MTRTTPGSAVRDAMLRASSPASAGVVFIFQLAATITSRMAPSCHRPTHPRRGRASRDSVPFGPARWTRRHIGGVERQRLDPAERALDAAARHSQLRGELAQRRLRGSAAERGHCPDRIWLSCKSAVSYTHLTLP